MATNTYVALKTTTLVSSSTSVVLDNLPQTYTDLVLVINAKDNRGGGAVTDSVGVTFNTDTSTGSTNYSFTYINGDGSTAYSGRASNYREIDLYRIGTTAGGSTFSPVIAHIMNYSNSTTYKTVIAKGGSSVEATGANVGTWRNTAAITSITLWPGYNGSGYTFESGSTFTIYGIAAEGALAKATGGAIYSDSQYWYHAFASSGTFTPTQSLTADILVVAGGGGAQYGNRFGGGGGGGGLLEFASQSLSATGYTVTVGAGGSVSTTLATCKGSNSSFGALTASVGGGGGATSGTNGASGGSGGGGGLGNSGGAATSGQGYAGGNGLASTPRSAGGGGGAGGAGSNATGTYGGNGGIGATSSLITAIGAAIGAGHNVSGTYYFAGGGGGSAYPYNDGLLDGGNGGNGGGGQGANYNGGSGNSTHNAIAGKPNTGGGGGGDAWYANGADGAAGGSGIVVIRYAK